MPGLSRTQDTSGHPHREGGGVAEMGGEMYFSQSVTTAGATDSTPTAREFLWDTPPLDDLSNERGVAAR
jgi:hypothetical protein